MGAVGGLVVLGAGVRPTAGASKAQPSPETAAPPSGAPVKVKVMYFQMPLAVGVSTEHFVLPSPARYGDLLPVVLKAHPALSPMMPTMMVLADGIPAQAGTPLRDGDEIDFIPAISGG